MEREERGDPEAASPSTDRGRDPDGLIRATVWAGNVPIPYLGAGAGAPVLLLESGRAASPNGSLFFRELAQHFRVIAPDPPGGDGTSVPFTAGVRGLLDGLGLPPVPVVADGGLGVLALGFMLVDPERVDRLVLAFRDVADPKVRGAAFADALSVTGRPVLVARVGPPPPGSDGPGFGVEVLSFLSGRAALVGSRP